MGNVLWEKFESSGKIEDYLAYVQNVKSDNGTVIINADNEGRYSPRA